MSKDIGIDTEDKAKKHPKKPWTGKHVLFAVVAFFSVIIAVNIAMVTLGVKSYPGEDTKQSYRQGIEYNDAIAERKRQAATGWTADIQIKDKNAVVLKITDRGGIAVRGLRVTGALKHPAKTDRDFILKFAQSADGTYIAPIDTALFGKQWLLITNAKTRDGIKFDTRNEIWLK